ncbi:MAG TPA: radical SAM protein [Candidatus Ozemobacteraceae bacterium]|nr:radical SAM protein [Candidatus Ozemobacteraceae bacterium]
MRKYVFGPVPSRRLGRSLGIDLIPPKTCTFECRYCQLSSTTTLLTQPQSFYPIEDILAELHEILNDIDRPDWITLSGAGEPTLHADLGTIIRRIKELHVAPVCVITNGTLLHLPSVQKALLPADRVIPTLCTVFPETFTRIHRPAPGIDLCNTLQGLPRFAAQFQGVLEVEIFVVPGINDTPQEVAGLSRFLSTLPRLAAVYLNTAVRPPHDASLRPATREELQQFKNRLALMVPVTTALDHQPVPKRLTRKQQATPEDILALLLRHPCTIEQLCMVLDQTPSELQGVLDELQRQGKITQWPDLSWGVAES